MVSSLISLHVFILMFLNAFMVKDSNTIYKQKVDATDQPFLFNSIMRLYSRFLLA